jgi:4-aminobutyrate aminotransferase-like enzyme
MMAFAPAGHLRVLFRHGKSSATLRSAAHQSGQSFTRQYAAAAAAAAAVSHHPTMPDIIEKSPLGFATESSAVLHRTLKSNPLQVVSAIGTNVTFSNGQTMEDTTCGAGVACIGYNNERVKKAMVEQIDKFAYCNSMFFGTPIGEQLAANLIEGTNGEMSKAYIMCSGSEAMESAMKMARQYYYELSPKQTKRVNFIAREGSYHGTTLGSLSMSGHVGRRNMFHELLMNNIYRVSPANEYHGKADGQTTGQYVQQLADELDRKFEEVGSETVCAFVAEPVVGAVSITACNIRAFADNSSDDWNGSGSRRLLQGDEESLRETRSSPDSGWYANYSSRSLANTDT